MHLNLSILRCKVIRRGCSEHHSRVASREACSSELNVGVEMKAEDRNPSWPSFPCNSFWGKQRTRIHAGFRGCKHKGGKHQKYSVNAGGAECQSGAVSCHF
jgi:hypothetical protein